MATVQPGKQNTEQAAVTAIVTAWRRPANIGLLAEALRRQSVRPMKIWAWANEPDELVRSALDEARFDRVVTCGDNAFFHGRFALALLAPTEYVALFDDDTIPGENWLRNCLETMARLAAEGVEAILGTAGVELHAEGYAERTMHGWQRPTDDVVEVDLVGQAWFLRTAWVKHLFADRPVTGTNGEDIELAARAWRLGGIRSFCPPHPAGDTTCWGSTRGLELGLDSVATSRGQSHLEQREKIVQAELAAGWKPLFARQRSAPALAAEIKLDSPAIPSLDSVQQPPVQQVLTISAGSHASRPLSVSTLVAHAGECSEPVSYNRGAIRDGRLEWPAEGQPCYDLVATDALDALEETLDSLRAVRARLKPGGRLVARVPNLGHAETLTALLAGNWRPGGRDAANGTPRPLRFFTRCELEKLFFRAGFAIDELAAEECGELVAWRNGDSPGRIARGGLSMEGLEPRDAQDLATRHFLIKARPAPAVDRRLTSIVIATWNQLACTRACLESIFHCTDEPFELVLVDNGSTDGTPEYLETVAAGGACRRVEVIRNQANRGFPAAANQGIEASRGEQILLLNNDVLVTTGWLARLLDALAADPQVGLVGPSTNYISGPQQIAASYQDLFALDSFAWRLAGRQRGVREETDRLVGFCLLVDRKVIDRVGLLDEQFGIGNFEDDDFCLRAHQAGFKAVIARAAFVHHFGHASFHGNGVDLNALLAHNEQLFRAKWPQAQATSRHAVPVNRPPTTDHRPLSLCMIVRDNAGTIEACLTSIRPWVDEMIVVDTGSNDETPAICERLGAKVFHFPWCDDFSAARNESLRHAKGEWIFWMDSDDVIDEANGRQLRELVESLSSKTIAFQAIRDGAPVANVAADSVMGFVVQVRCPAPPPDGPHEFTVVDHCKLIRNRPDLRFEHRMHEQIMPAINRAGGEIVFTDLFVVHAGADRTPDGRRRKLIRDLRLLRRDLRERPKHPFILFNVGMTFDDIHRHAKAVRYLRASLAVSDPKESHVRKVYALLANNLARLEQLDEALSACREGLQKFPGDVEILFRLGTIELQQGRPAAAVEAFQQLLAAPAGRYLCSYDHGIKGFKARQNLAIAYERLGDLAAAENQWRAIIAEVPACQEGWLGLAENLALQGRTGELAGLAAELRCRLESPCGGEPAASIIESRALTAARQTGQAVAVLEQAMRRHPDDEGVLREYCHATFGHGDPLDCVAGLESLLNRCPYDASAWQNLGAAYLQAGGWEGAAHAFESSLELRPDDPKTLSLLAGALHRLGCRDGAQQALRGLLRVDPFNESALESLSQLRDQEICV